MGPKNFEVQNILGPKNVCPKIRVEKNEGQSKFWSRLDQINKKNWAEKFGQNWVHDNRDIPDMDKCHQDKCCLDECHCDSWMFKMVPGTYL